MFCLCKFVRRHTTCLCLALVLAGLVSLKVIREGNHDLYTLQAAQIFQVTFNGIALPLATVDGFIKADHSGELHLSSLGNRASLRSRRWNYILASCFAESVRTHLSAIYIQFTKKTLSGNACWGSLGPGDYAPAEGLHWALWRENQGYFVFRENTVALSSFAFCCCNWNV